MTKRKPQLRKKHTLPVSKKTPPEEMVYLARLKALIEKTAAWERGDLAIVNAPRMTEPARRHLEQQVLQSVWRDMIREAEQLAERKRHALDNHRTG